MILCGRFLRYANRGKTERKSRAGMLEETRLAAKHPRQERVHPAHLRGERFHI
jgi:hypothetical protein